MDTRPLLDMAHPLASSGLTLSHTRVDPAEFSKLSMCGLQCGICACGDVIIEGEGNVISGLVLTKPEARLHLRGENNQVWGVPQERIHQM